jgi:hypothetical protein
MRTSQKTPGNITTVGIDLGKNTRHALEAGGDESAERAYGKDVPPRPPSAAMDEQPRQPAGRDRNSGRAHEPACSPDALWLGRAGCARFRWPVKTDKARP